MKATRKSRLSLLLVVFIDLLGLGLLSPLIPFYVARLGTTPEVITIVIATYALFQFIGAPLWSSLSDRVGRRPVLLLSMAGHAAAYLILAFADSVWLLLLSRALGGFTSANLATAYAYIIDTTTEENRAANFGRVSAAFGLGFILGPILGSALAGGGDAETANFVRPALAAMLLSLVSFVGIFFFIPESRQQRTDASTTKSVNYFGNFIRVVKGPLIASTIIIGLLTTLFIAGREAIFPLWANQKHALTLQQVGIVISTGAIVLTTVQLTAIGRITKVFGELYLLRTSLVLFALCWLGLAYAESFVQILVATALGALAMAIFQTPLQSYLSKIAPAEERGAVMGVYQSMSSLGRFGGQAVSGTIYGRIGIDALFLIGAAAMVPVFFLALRLSRKDLAERSRETDLEKLESKYG